MKEWKRKGRAWSRGGEAYPNTWHGEGGRLWGRNGGMTRGDRLALEGDVANGGMEEMEQEV